MTPARRLLLIDPWLTDTGGHNYQYALDVLQAAQQQGWHTCLAVNRSLPATTHFPLDWTIVRAFQFGACTRHWLGPDGRNPFPCDLDGKWLPAEVSRSRLYRLGEVWRQLRGGLSRWDRRRRIVDFARGCSHFLDVVEPRPGDLYFLPSLSEFDFLGVARFLRDDSRTRPFTWHLQFHFNFLVGRDPEYGSQTDRLKKLQRQFHEALRQIPRHDLRFYSTTPPMARQYDQLAIARFEPLPYPVRQLIQLTPVVRDNEPLSARRPQPLQVTFAGGMRREKGKKKLGSLVAALWPDYLATGKMQLVFQSSPRLVSRWLTRELRRQVTIARPNDLDSSAPIRTVTHPLAAAEYSDLIRSTGLGVFLYDSRRYYARASGIQGEMLAAGVPILVPAGCWLADLVAAENYGYVAVLAKQGDPIPCQRTGDSSAHRDKWEFTASLPPETRDLIVQLDWPESLPLGIYLETAARWVDAEGRTVGDQHLSVLGAPSSAARPGALFRVPDGARQVHLQLQSAYMPYELPTVSLQLAGLGSPSGMLHRPLSRVGLVAANADQYPDLLREMYEHYEHYRRAAREFAVNWLERHHPQRTLEQLQRSDAIAVPVNAPCCSANPAA